MIENLPDDIIREIYKNLNIYDKCSFTFINKQLNSLLINDCEKDYLLFFSGKNVITYNNILKIIKDNEEIYIFKNLDKIKCKLHYHINELLSDIIKLKKFDLVKRLISLNFCTRYDEMSSMICFNEQDYEIIENNIFYEQLLAHKCCEYGNLELLLFLLNERVTFLSQKCVSQCIKSNNTEILKYIIENTDIEYLDELRFCMNSNIIKSNMDEIMKNYCANFY